MGGRPQSTDLVVRIIDGKAFAVSYDALVAIPDKAQKTIADWDFCFATQGDVVQLTPEALAALRDLVGQNLASIVSSPITDATVGAFLSYDSQKQRLDALVAGQTAPIESADLITYGDLVSHANILLGTDVAEAFIEQYGFAGLWRLRELTTTSHWELVISDLSVYHRPADYTPYYTGPGYYGHYFSTRRFKTPQEPTDARRIEVSDRLVSDGMLFEHPDRATASEIAERVYDAIHVPGVTVHGGTITLESTASAAWQAFWAHPNTGGTLRMGMGVMQFFAGWAMIPASGFTAGIPGAIVAIRGGEEAIAGLMMIITQDPNYRNVSQQTVDSVTGDEATTDRLILVADLASGGWATVNKVRSAAQASKLTATEARAAVQSRAGQATEDATEISAELIDVATSTNLRAAHPITSTVTNIELNSSKFDAWLSQFGQPSEGLGRLIRDLPSGSSARSDLARLLREVRASGGAVSNRSLTGGTYAQFIPAGDTAFFRYQPSRLRIVDLLEEQIHWDQIRTGQHLRSYGSQNVVDVMEILAKRAILQRSDLSPALRMEIKWDLWRIRNGRYGSSPGG